MEPSRPPNCRAKGATERTYTEIYPRINDSPWPGGGSLAGMWKKIRTATAASTVIAVWFAVVTLGFGGHLWPLLEGVR